MTDSHVYSALTGVVSGHKRKTGHATGVPGVLVSRSVGVCLDIDAMLEDTEFQEALNWMQLSNFVKIPVQNSPPTQKVQMNFCKPAHKIFPLQHGDSVLRKTFLENFTWDCMLRIGRCTVRM